MAFQPSSSSRPLFWVIAGLVTLAGVAVIELGYFPTKTLHLIPFLLTPVLIFSVVLFYLIYNSEIQSNKQDVKALEMHNTALETRIDMASAFPVFDSITGLPTFVVAKDRIDAAIHRAKRRKQLIAVYRVQLDTNSTLSARSQGISRARAIKQKAKSMKMLLRNSDSVMHVGRRNFLVIAESLDNLSDVRVVNQKLEEALAIPLLRNASASIHIGNKSYLAVFPMDGDSSSSILTSLEDNFRADQNIHSHTDYLLALET
jgi:GGDEF domain-containing protein